MKTLLPILVLICAGVCSAQQPKYFGCGVNGTCGNAEQTVRPAPLKCGKWEEHTGGVCSVSYGKPIVCGDRCVPKLHTVTEKEWQELMERLKKLENPPCPSILDKSPKQCPL